MTKESSAFGDRKDPLYVFHKEAPTEAIRPSRRHHDEVRS